LANTVYLLSIIIPTLNASDCLHDLLTALGNQSVKDKEVIIIDSSSTDSTVEIARSFNATITVIPKEQFDHGGTRNIAASKAKGDILIFMTQDAMPANKHALENLIQPFESDEKIAAIYGRQLPGQDATPFNAHLRLFNYPDTSYVRDYEDKNTHGFKTIFISNSFSAYRKALLEKIGWFKDNLIFGEDTYAVARLLREGYKVAYTADAMVYHSHNYTAFQEFERYFDIGVLHRSADRTVKEFGKAKAEGSKYIKSGISYLLNNNKSHLIPSFLFRNSLKYMGYNLGFRYDKIPRALACRLSMNKTWWGKTGKQ